MSLKSGHDRSSDLIGYINITCRYQRCGRVNRRYIYGSVKEITELLLRIPQNRCTTATHEAGWTERRVAACASHRR
jgi:hypothetical protein